MAIYAIGANYEKVDVSKKFIKQSIAGPGWSEKDAPELKQFIASLKVGDIIYIKSFSASSDYIFIKAIGFIEEQELLTGPKTKDIVSSGRRVKWVVTDEFKIPKPHEKNNVRANTLYEEFHPEVQKAILKRLVMKLK
jgi:hypothetical protein